MPHLRRPMALGLCLPTLLAGCMSGPAATPTPASCDGLPAEIGACSPDRPVFTGTTCHDVAVEWGTTVVQRLTAIIDGPKGVDGKAWSVRIGDVLVLTSVLVGMRMRDLGIVEACDTPEFLPAARQQFSPTLDERILAVLYDGTPATPADWDADLYRYIGVIDDDSPGVATSPSA